MPQEFMNKRVAYTDLKTLRLGLGDRSFRMNPFDRTQALFRRWVVVLALVLVAASAPANAGTKKWDGGAANSDWISGLNWSSDNVPAPGDDIVLDASFISIPGSMVVNGGVVSAQTLTFAAGFNPTSTTLIGNGGGSPSFLVFGGSVSVPNPLIRVNSTGGTVTFDRRNGGTADLKIELSAATLVDVNSGATLNVHCEISGPYGLTKTGPGTLRLGGTNIHTGGTTVSQGTLALVTAGSSSGSFAASSGITVNSGATLDVSGVAFTVQAGQTLAGSGTVNGSVSAAAGSTLLAGPGGMASTLTLNNNLTADSATLVFDLASLNTEGSGVNDEIIIAGNLDLSGNNVIFLNYLDGSLPAGTYRIIKYLGSKTGNFVLGAPYQNVTLDETTTPNYVTLVVSGGGSSVLNLTWTGDDGGNVWDLATTANWLNGVNASGYYDPANVTFDDSGSTAPSINLTTTVGPRSLTVNSVHNYTISGIGRIGSIPGLNNALIKSGSGSLTLGTSNYFSGGVDIQAGTLKIGNVGAIPSGIGRGDVSVAGTLDLNANSITLNGLAGGGIVDNQSGSGTYTLTLGANNSGGTFSGVIRNTSGTLALSKTGSGTLALNGNNAFFGAVTISGGILRISHANALGSTAGNTTVSGGAALGRLELTGGITVNENLALAMKFGVGSGSKDSQVPHVENISGDNTLNGSFTLTSGGTFWTFQSDAGKLILNKGLSALASGGRPILLQGAGDGEIKGPIQNGSGQVALVKSGSGSWTLSGTNDYGQGTTINAGTLRLGSSNAIPRGAGKGDVVVDGTLDLNGNNATLNGLSGSGIVDNVSGAGSYLLSLGDNNRSGTFSGVIRNTSGSVAVSKIGSGTLTLNGNNIFSGNTTVNAGTLLVNGSIASPLVLVNSGATLGGSGAVNGSVVVQVGGTLSPGTSLGTLAIGGSLTLSGNAVMEINKAGAALASDLVLGVSALTYGGTLAVVATGDPLAENDSFNLFDAASFGGAFATFSLPPLPSCLVWDTSRLTLDGTVKVVREAVGPVIGTVTATEVQSGTVDVKNCAATTLQGTVNVAVQASDNCALVAAPTVMLTNGSTVQSAALVNESPSGTFNYVWVVTSGTTAGTWTAAVAATDTAGNATTSSFTLCVAQPYQVTGQIELQGFVGSTRAVTFVVTSSANTPLLTNTQTLAFSGSPVKLASFTLSVPLNAANLSAKTAWNLRKRLPLTFAGGQAVANYAGATRLLAGDIAAPTANPPQDNRVNTSDNTTFKIYNGKLVSTTPAAAQADITGDGRVNTSDYTLLKSNLGKLGEAQ